MCCIFTGACSCSLLGYPPSALRFLGLGIPGRHLLRQCFFGRSFLGGSHESEPFPSPVSFPCHHSKTRPKRRRVHHILIVFFLLVEEQQNRWILCLGLSSPSDPPIAQSAAQEILFDALHDERLAVKERKLCKHGRSRLLNWNEAGVRRSDPWPLVFPTVFMQANYVPELWGGREKRAPFKAGSFPLFLCG